MIFLLGSFVCDELRMQKSNAGAIFVVDST